MSPRSLGTHVRALPCLLLILALTLVAAPGWAASPPAEFSRPPDAASLAPQDASAAICHPTIPQADCDAAVFVYEYVLTHNWSPPKGYAGGKKFANKNGTLPPGDYREYDIYPRPPPNSGGRDAKRIVIDVGTQTMFYTADHYVTFVLLTYS
jgi:guanyl-specific ribonuclease Sa